MLENLTVQGLSWCQYHGHPILRLQDQTSEKAFWITLTVEDAQVMSPAQQQVQTGRVRLFQLVEQLLEVTGARLTSVRIGLERDSSLGASLQIVGSHGGFAQAVHIVDAVILSWRHQLPLRIETHDLERICDLTQELPHSAETETERAKPSEREPDPIRQFIDTLDFGALDQPN